MKVGTDAVLLGAWAKLDGAHRILDIGTGSGLIALIAAQRTDASCVIDGIEIQEPDSLQAMANAAGSPWADRVRIIHSSVQEYQPPWQYDVILCNPPYFRNSLKPSKEGRATARHTVTLDPPALVAAFDRLLSPSGCVSVIMPPVEALALISLMRGATMYPIRRCEFRTRTGRKAERLLLTFARARHSASGTGEEPVVAADETGLVLYADGSRWTREYSELTKELYLPGK